MKTLFIQGSIHGLIHNLSTKKTRALDTHMFGENSSILMITLYLQCEQSKLIGIRGFNTVYLAAVINHNGFRYKPARSPHYSFHRTIWCEGLRVNQAL